MIDLVIDTNVFVRALRTVKDGSIARRVIRRCLKGDYCPLFGVALFNEYDDVIKRNHLFADGATQSGDRETVLAALANAGRWVQVYYDWRPNLTDEGDNHLIELAIAGGARAIVTYNVRDLTGGELKFPGLEILTPKQCLESFPCPH